MRYKAGLMTNMTIVVIQQRQEEEVRLTILLVLLVLGSANDFVCLGASNPLSQNTPPLHITVIQMIPLRSHFFMQVVRSSQQ